MGREEPLNGVIPGNSFSGQEDLAVIVYDAISVYAMKSAPDLSDPCVRY